MLTVFMMLLFVVYGPSLDESQRQLAVSYYSVAKEKGRDEMNEIILLRVDNLVDAIVF